MELVSLAQCQNDSNIHKLIKIVINFIWGTIHEVKKELFYAKGKNRKAQGNWTGPKWKITFFTLHVSSGFNKNVVWITEVLSWPKTGSGQDNVYHIINYCTVIFVQLFTKPGDNLYGGTFPYKPLDTSEYDYCINSKSVLYGIAKEKNY